MVSVHEDVVKHYKSFFSSETSFLVEPTVIEKKLEKSEIFIFDATELSSEAIEKIRSLKKYREKLICLVPCDIDSACEDYLLGFVNYIVPFPSFDEYFCQICDKISNHLSDIVTVNSFEANYQHRLLHLKKAIKGMFPGISKCMIKTRDDILRAASDDSPVLLLGETGTGKTTAANLIHKLSSRSRHTFKTINMADLEKNTATSALFGNEDGAYTDGKYRDGIIKTVHKGTVFFDEFDTCDLEIQAKFLTVLENGEFFPMGNDTLCYSDFRSIFATNSDILQLIQMGKFRMDLFYRINKTVITIPPLREHKEDIPCLVESFAKNIGKDVDERIFQPLMEWDWPGNIRELQDCMNRSARENKNVIECEDLDFGLTMKMPQNILYL